MVQFYRIVPRASAVISMKNVKRWTVVFRALSNSNRLKILEILSGGKKMSVGDIARTAGISLKSTSNHLVIFKNLDVVEPHGEAGHVFYRMNPQLPKDFQTIVHLLGKNH